MTDRSTCANLAKAVYGKKKNYIPDGWTQIAQIEFPYLDENNYKEDRNGFSAAAYKSVSTNKIIISYRGTTDSADWLFSNAAMGLDRLPDQYSNALDFYRAVRQEFKENNITFTGHSLGGALAQLLGATIEAELVKDVNYLETYAYNAPGVSHLLNDLSIEQSVFSTIKNYVNMSDIVGNLANVATMGDHLGTTYYLAPTPMTKNLFSSHGEYFANPLNPQPAFTSKQGLALWYYDANNDPGVKTLIGGLIDDADLYSAIKVLREELPVFQYKLHYKTMKGDIILGSADNDGLYGQSDGFFGGGEDIIYGNSGVDVLNGKSGDDILYSGSGDDIINAGDDDDELHGGTGNDILNGADGYDIYYYKSGDGQDTIIDSDGKGRIIIDNDFVLSVAKKTAEGSGLYADKLHNYQMDDNNLIITDRATHGEKVRITILNFNKEKKGLGIDLQDN